MNLKNLYRILQVSLWVLVVVVWVTFLFNFWVVWLVACALLLLVAGTLLGMLLERTQS